MAEIAQTFSIDPYAADRAKIARQQKFAELLQSQALQPNEKFSYAGIEAPISAAGGLAKALQAGMSGYLQGDAARKEDAANIKQETDYNAANEAFTRGMTPTPEDPGTRGMSPATEEDVDSRAMSIAQGSTAPPLTLGEPVDVLGGLGARGTEGTPGTPAIPGSYDRVMKELSGLTGNPYAGRLSQQLVMRKLEQNTALQQAAAEREAQFTNAVRLKQTPGAEPTPADMQGYQYDVKNNGFKGSFADWSRSKLAPQEQWIPGVGPNGEPIQISSTTGQRQPAPGKVPDATEYGLKSATFADRMDEAEAVLSLNDPASLDPAQRAYEMIPGGAYMMSPAYQKISQAERNFVTALLRLESGATISPEEFASAKKQYFPQPGEGPEVIAQKAANRATVIAGMKRSAGPRYVPAASARPAVPPKPATEMNDDEIRQTLGLPPVGPPK